MTTVERVMTVEEFDTLISQSQYRDRHFELIDGQPVEKSMPTEEHGEIAGNMLFAFKLYFSQHKTGRVFVEARYKTGDHEARQPDVAVRMGNEPTTTRGSAPYIPDIAVEIQSPDDSIKQLRDKANYYLSVGVKLVMLVLTVKKLVIVLTSEDEQILTLDDTLTGLALLPGFELPIQSLFGEGRIDTISPATEQPTNTNE